MFSISMLVASIVLGSTMMFGHQLPKPKPQPIEDTKTVGDQEAVGEIVPGQERK